MKKSLIILFMFTAVFGQQERRFSHMSIEDGLSANYLRCLYQDQAGYLWVGTDNGGLNRFDGRNVTFYLHDQRDSKSLSNNQVFDVIEDQRGRLWVATADGLNLFHKETETFTSYFHEEKNPKSLPSNSIFHITQAANQKLWLYSGNQYVLWNPDSNEVEETLPSNILAIYWDGLNQWRTTYTEVFKITKTGKPHKIYKHSRPFRRPIFHKTHQGDIVFSSTQTLLIYDKHGNLTEHKLPFALHTISSLTSDTDGNIWFTRSFGGTDSGLALYNPQTKTVHNYRNNPSNHRSLIWNFTTDTIIDRSNVLWIATSRGLSKHDLNGSKFGIIRQSEVNGFSLSDNYYGIHKVGDLLYLGIDGPGFFTYHLKTKKFTSYINPNFEAPDTDGFPSFGLRSITQVAQDKLWMGSGTGIVELNMTTKKMQKVDFNNNPSDSLFVFHLAQSHDGRIWVSTQNVLFLVNPITKEDQVIMRKNTRFSHTLEVSPSEVWISTSSQLLKYHPQEQTFKSFQHDPKNTQSIISNRVTCTHKDKKGYLWVGTEDGLSRLAPNQETFTNYTKNRGLNALSVNSIAEDNAGRIWFGTDQGLKKYDHKTETFTSFDQQDGIQGSRFNNNSVFKTAEGQLLFGGTGGLNIFWGEKIKDNGHKAEAVITKISFSQGKASRQTIYNINNDKKITLNHNQNDFTIHYAALHYSNPKENMFKYYLENFAQHWSPPTYDNKVSFTNLDPGTYVFHVQASNNDGVWNEEDAKVTITINPPWWQHWLAYLIYSILALITLIAYTRHQTEKERMRQQQKNQKERERAQLREAELARIAAEAEARAVLTDSMRKTEELERARQVQISMLPNERPISQTFEIAASSETATEIGGDYYDFHYEQEQLTIVLGDATGHGLHAGILVAAAKSLFIAHRNDPDLCNSLSRFSDAFKKMGFKSMYMGMILARLHNQKLQITSAGMPFPILYNAKTQKLQEIPIKAVPLGAPMAFTYELREVPFESGDILILLSDGLMEMFNPSDKMLGNQKILAKVKEITHKSADEIVDELKNFGQTWAQGIPSQDDVTLLVLKAR